MHLLKGNLSLECGKSRGDAGKQYLVLCVMALTIAARHVKFGTKKYHQLNYTPHVFANTAMLSDMKYWSFIQ
jgi:hypothetical protein